MVSTKVVRQALYERLNTASVTSLLGSGSASIVHGVAPSSASFPLCVFQKQAGTSTHRFGGNAYDDHIWLVKGVVRASSSSVAEDIAKAVSDRLDFARFTLAQGNLMHIARESDVDFVETNGDVQYRHHGSLYRVVVQD